MSNIKPEFSRLASEGEHNVDTNWKIDNDPPPIIMGIQSQFAHLQLLQSKVCKQKAEEGIRQVQDCQKKQYDSRMYAAEAQKLLAQAKRDGTTDVNKKLEEFCKKNDIPFKKLEITQGKANLLRLCLSGFMGFVMTGLAIIAVVAVCAATGVKIPDNLGNIVMKAIDFITTIAPLVRSFLPKDLQLKFDAVMKILNIIKTLLGPFCTTSQQRKTQIAAIQKELAANPVSHKDLNAIIAIGKREGIFTEENAHRVAADMGMDLAGTLKDLDSLGKDFAANLDIDKAWEDAEIEVSKEWAELLAFPYVLMAMVFGGKSYDEALKVIYHSTKIGEASDAANWANVLNALEAMNAQETGRSQLLMVNINHHIGQYNSYLQGAMTAIANANQVNTAIAKGSG